MQDQFDVTLEDSDLLSEVELTTNLIIAASAAPGHLDQAEVDVLLGVEPTDEPPDEPTDESADEPTGETSQQVANSTGPLERSERT